jgi:hypothetical protein
LAITEPRLNTDQQRVLTMLATAGPSDLTQLLLGAHGFDASMIAGLVNCRLATLRAEKVLADES